MTKSGLFPLPQQEAAGVPPRFCLHRMAQTDHRSITIESSRTDSCPMAITAAAKRYCHLVGQGLEVTSSLH
jgi:hypothetical protein